MPRRPPYLHREVTRHDKIVWFVRRGHGARIRLKTDYDTKEFWAEYRDALSGATPARTRAAPRANSLAWAIEKYRRSSDWAALAPATRKQRESILKAVETASGAAKLADITDDDIRDGREDRAATPHSANNFLKAMRGLFAWALEYKHVKVDPTKGVTMLKGRNDKFGFHTWTEDEVARFEARWPVGTRERLAFDILLYTGLRRGDAVRLGRQHVRGHVIVLRTEKTDEDVVLPVLDPLARSIAAAQVGDLAFLVTERGLPFVKESFGNWFGKLCRATGCPGSAHGLRKAGATRAAENGATDKQLMAMYGWRDTKMATHYTRKADKLKLAMEAAQRVAGGRSENEKRPHLEPSAGVTSEKAKKTGA